MRKNKLVEGLINVFYLVSSRVSSISLTNYSTRIQQKGLSCRFSRAANRNYLGWGKFHILDIQENVGPAKCPQSACRLSYYYGLTFHAFSQCPPLTNIQDGKLFSPSTQLLVPFITLLLVFQSHFVATLHKITAWIFRRKDRGYLFQNLLFACALTISLVCIFFK